MKRSAAGTYPTYKQAVKRQRTKGTYKAASSRKGYGSVARSRGAAVTGEMKYFDTECARRAITVVGANWPAGTMADPDTTINLGSAAVATPLCLFDPTVGAGLNQRVGRQVKVLKLKVHGYVSADYQTAAANPDESANVRLLLVQDMQTNAAQMTGAALMQDGATGYGTINTFQNPNNFGRFRVLKDKRFFMSNQNISGNGVANQIDQSAFKIPFKFNINFKVPITVHFNATNGGTVADIVDHSFHVVCGADTVAQVPLLTYYTRVCFKE